MQSFVSVVTPDNLEDFLKDDSKVKMLLFSEKKEAPPIMKALSKEFRSSIDIALVKDFSGKVMNRFGVKSVPTIIILKKTDGENWTPILYEGQVTVMGLSDFIREHRELNSGGKKKQKKINDVTKVSDFSKFGCGTDSKQVCILLLYTDESEQREIVESLEGSVSSLTDEPIIALTLPKTLISLQSLSLPDSTGMLLLKPNKNRLHAVDSKGNDVETFNSLVDKVIGGTLSFKPSSIPFFDSIESQDQSDL
jgi:hypothetical protein